MKLSLRPVLTAAALSVAAFTALSGSAMAAAPTGDYTDFKYCPYNNTAVTSCVYSKTTSGSFKLGNANVPITAATPIILQGGITGEGGAGPEPFVPAVGADTLSKTKLKVPGGLIGLVDTGGFTGALISLFNAAVASANDVYATAELVGPVQFSLSNVLNQTGTGVALPVRIHLENPFLGSGCYIGSSSNPVRLNLTTATTSPPPPNTPITGSPGFLTFNPDFTVITSTGVKLVDNSFAAPAATNCGFLLLDRLLITAAVNLKEGLPAAAGKNAAIQEGTTKLGDRAYVAASVQ
jgi:hypothetical protein